MSQKEKEEFVFTHGDRAQFLKNLIPNSTQQLYYSQLNQLANILEKGEKVTKDHLMTMQLLYEDTKH